MKLYITGPSGVGTTTLGKSLEKILSVEQKDTDDLFWLNTDPPFTKQRDIGSLHKLFYRITSNKKFILSGDCLNWGVPKLDLLNCFTHVIHLYLPWEIREHRIRSREKDRFGHRIESGGDMYQTHEAFIQWASKYESDRQVGRNLLSQKNFINQFKGKSIFINEQLNEDELIRLALKFLGEI